MSETRSATGETTEITPEAKAPLANRRDWGAVFAAIIAVATLISVALLEKIAWEKLHEAEETLQRAHSESLALGARMQESLAWMKLWHLLYLATGEQENRNSFNNEARRLSTMLAEGKAQTGNSDVRARIEEVERGVRDFLTRAEVAEPVTTLRRGTVETLTADLQRMLDPILAATTNLEKLQEQTRARLKATSAEAFQAARSALRRSLLALVVLLGAMALLAYRTFLVPLKSRLAESAAETTRHEKLASIGVLATGVAHEIRNPLTAIKFRLFSLKKSLGVDLSTNEDFVTIRSEIDRLELLVKNFLEFARPTEPQFVQISATDLLHDVKQLLDPEMRKKELQISVDSVEGLDFRADRQQLRQVLINLAQNAGDSTPPSGTITLRAHSGVATFGARRRPAILLDVVDTGAGIDPEVQKRLFEPFFSTKEGGTGLGLAIASRIVEQHGGSLQFSTRKNQGSTFTIVLPQEPATGSANA